MSGSSEEHLLALSPGDLLGAFRTVYRRYHHLVLKVTSNPTDSTVLTRLSDELDEYLVLVNQVWFLKIFITANNTDQYTSIPPSL